MAKKHINIPVFIPHLGCPNQCVFCNQRTISGVGRFDHKSVIPIIEEALKTKREDQEAEIAFFGGSFTGIDPELMTELLKIANSYLIQGRISSIRCSTRPDYINPTILDTLVRYGVGTVELGLQSYSDKVLCASKRGHDSECERRACDMIRNSGIRLGGQMMIGLPYSTGDDEVRTARFIAESGCDEARIYPTLVFRETELASMVDSGEYIPLCEEEAVARSADAFSVLVRAGVKILRIGLCDSDNLHSSDTYLAGPNHPAMGELVVGEYYYREIAEKLCSLGNVQNGKITVYAPRGETSKIIGQNKKNKIRLLQEFRLSDLKVVEKDGLAEYSVLLSTEERK